MAVDHELLGGLGARGELDGVADRGRRDVRGWLDGVADPSRRGVRGGPGAAERPACAADASTMNRPIQPATGHGEKRGALRPLPG